MRPFRSRSRTTAHVAQRPTRFALAMSTRGASGWVRNTPTGLPDWTRRVSSSSNAPRVRHTASKQAQSRTAFPVPPYTTSSWGRSATSGSRLFMSIRSAASWIQPLQDRCGPRGARTTLGPVTVPDPAKCGMRSVECGIAGKGGAPHDTYLYIPQSAFRIPHSCCPRIELPLPYTTRDSLDVRGQRPVTGERRHFTPHHRVDASDASPRGEGLQELKPLRRGHQLDRDDAGCVRENPLRLPGRAHPHGHHILLVALPGHRLHAGPR